MPFPGKSLTRVVSALCEAIGSPRAQTVHMLIQHGEWAQLQALRVNPSDYVCGEALWGDSMVTELLRKAQLEDPERLEREAVDLFFVIEHGCKSTNDRLARFLPTKNRVLLPGETGSPSSFRPLCLTETDWRVHDFICHVRKEVGMILGSLPLWLTPRFSRGATVSDTSRLSTIPDKMSSRATFYPHSSDLLKFWEETSWGRLYEDKNRPTTVRANHFFTVPKDSTKRRGCAKEASINIALQLDVGRYIKTRLKATVGIDLWEGQERNSQLARWASTTGHLATIDMSNASDTIAKAVVELFLPEEWFMLLSSLRATHTRVDGKLVRLEKFSSMGNGFTFELETVIFAALARVVTRLSGDDPSQVSCYGDDLIVPSSLAVDVMASLRMFGFTPNAKKTFWEGPFRESCGGDFFKGVPVRAHYIEELPDEPQKWIALANGLRNAALYRAADEGFSYIAAARWTKVHRAWRLCIDQLPSNLRRIRGPRSLGDLVIHDHESAWETRPYRERGAKVGPRGGKTTLVLPGQFDCPTVLAYVPIPLVLPWSHWLPAVQHASCTLGTSSAGITPRKGVSGYHLKWVEIPGSSWLPNDHSS